MTFFLSIEIFDEFIKKINYAIEEDSMHLYLITCLFIASKIEETKKLSADLIIRKVAQSKYTKEELLQRELIVLKKLNFSIPKNHFIDYVNIIFYENFYTTNHHCLFSEIVYSSCKNIYKVLLLDFFRLRFNSNSLLVYSSVFIYSLYCVIKGINFNHCFNAKLFFKTTSQYNISEEQVEEYVMKISTKMDNFQSEKEIYPYLYNELFGVN